MNFTEKLTRLTEDRSKSAVAAEAGLPPTAISNYLNKKHTPAADTALKIARALQVPLEWLVDDEQEWPQPPVAAMSALSAEELAAELGARFIGVGRALFANLRTAEGAKWEAMARELLNADPDDDPPRSLEKLMALPSQIEALGRELRRFDPAAQLGEAIGPVHANYRLSLLDLVDDLHRFVERPDYRAAVALAALWTMPKKWRPPWFADNVKYVREVAKAELDKLAESSAKPAPRKTTRQQSDK